MYVHTVENQELFNRALAKQMRAELAVCDLSNDQVAERLKIYRGTLYKYLRAETRVPGDIIFGLCKILDIPPERFINRVVDRMKDFE